MREIFQDYARRGTITIKELAAVLRRSEDWVRRNSQGSECLIPRLPGYPIRFDPSRMIDVFCQAPRVIQPSSLTIERHKTGAKEGFRKCL